MHLDLNRHKLVSLDVTWGPDALIVVSQKHSWGQKSQVPKENPEEGRNKFSYGTLAQYAGCMLVVLHMLAHLATTL